jgi:hypothetical protein
VEEALEVYFTLTPVRMQLIEDKPTFYHNPSFFLP